MGTLGPKYILYGYMEPLGLGLGGIVLGHGSSKRGLCGSLGLGSI